ncbi:hypothetical protein CCYA_CCYA02G0618 [Cyanidiococcus yangmingshanensis]|nr:hypothetical protein CCYA_CCYA02G0618 [Cyanidiococcus yangmingshanensis]
MQIVRGLLRQGQTLHKATFRAPDADVHFERHPGNAKKTLNGANETEHVEAASLPRASTVPPTIRALIQARASRSFWAQTHVDAIQDDGLIINGLVFRSSALLLLPHFVLSVSSLHRLEDLHRDSLCLLELIKPSPTAFVIGSNQFKSRTIGPVVPPDIDRYLREHLRLSYECTSLVNACATFNVLNEERRFPAALVMLDESPDRHDP